MIGGYPIGAQPVGAFRRILSGGASGIVGIAAASIVISASAAGTPTTGSAAAASLALAASTAGALTTGGIAAATLALAGSIAGALASGGSASVALAIAATGAAALRTGGTATALFTITASAAATIAGGIITYTPSTARQLSGGAARNLSAPGDRLLFGGGVRLFQGE